jgi:hypothetical protein
MLQRRKRTFFRGPTGAFFFRGMEGVPFGDGLVEPSSRLANRLLSGPAAIELEIGPDPAEGEPGQKFGDAAGPNADVGEFFGQVSLLRREIGKVSRWRALLGRPSLRVTSGCWRRPTPTGVFGRHSTALS